MGNNSKQGCSAWGERVVSCEPGIYYFPSLKSLKKGAGIETVSISIALSPIYRLWAMIVAFIFPIIFGFR
ncbi:MAG: hypothetical protein IPG02_16255 [Ignavibacteria bacterium]|nr:hypothetical protein [Ignavibacteria bacterium]